MNLPTRDAVERAYEAIEASVDEKAGARHFQGVTVQPMVQLSDGYELIIGSSLDAQFGPVLLFGTGGQLVEVFKDRALALPPLNTTLARRMMEQTKIYTALKGVRGRKPVDLPALEAAPGALQPPGGRAAVDQGDRHQPAAGRRPNGLLALDARVVLHGPEVTEDQTPHAGHPALPHAVRRAAGP